MSPHNVTASAPVLGARRVSFALLALPVCILLFLSLALACTLGPVKIPYETCLRVLLFLPSKGDVKVFLPNGVWQVMSSDAIEQIVFGLRLPRVLLSLCTGSALAISGVVFQGILRNPLADPFTLGISSGAACGAALAISFGLQGLALGFGIPALAFAGALAALFVVLLLGGVRSGLQKESLILAGIIVSAFLAALISLVKALDESSVTGIVFWIMGSFQGRTWAECLLAFPAFLLGAPFVLFLYRELDMLQLGDKSAANLGLSAAKHRFFLLLVASAMTAGCVAVSGIIGFIGLVVPHLCRLFVGAEHRFLLPLSVLLGGLLLIWSDVAARSVLPGGVELPVGVITALLGGPFFCYLLYKQNQTATEKAGGAFFLPGNASFGLEPSGPDAMPAPGKEMVGNTPCLEADMLTVHYIGQSKSAVCEANVTLRPGEWVGLLGPNGSGKSSLLRCLAGTQTPYAGAVRLFERPIAAFSSGERARQMAVLPQSAENVPAISVFSFVLMGRYPHTPFLGAYTKKDRAIAMAALKETGIGHLALRFANTLSGGELQRALLARCFAQNTPLLLLDEATTGLDPTYQLGVFSAIRARQEAHNIAVIAAMHDLNLAALYCSRIVILRRGRIVADGSVDEVFARCILEDVYETPLRIIEHPQTKRPQVMFLAK